MLLRLAVVVLSLVVVSGCQRPKLPGFVSKLWNRDAETEVETHAPKRTQIAQDDTPSSIPLGPQTVKSSEIQLTEFVTESEDSPELFGATVVATVNSMPIFADDVLEPFAANLNKAEAQLTPEQMNLLRTRLVRENLPQHIEKATLLTALRDDVEEEQFDQLMTQVEAMFEKEVERLQKRYDVATKIELQQVLEQQSTSLENLQNAFAARELAMFYIGRKAKTDVRFSRQDLLNWYEENKSQYLIEAASRWQQIRINQERDGGRQAAFEVMQQAIDALRNGTEFGKVAKQFSDGPKSDDGGVWDWTKQGSLADELIERALFEVPVGKISQPLDTGSAFVLVKVLERQEQGYTPFEEVQDKINSKLQSEARRNAADKVIQDLNNTATIWTIFDSSPN